MRGFSAVDYLAVVFYLLAIAGIGSSFYRRRTTPRDYFLGGRSMSWLPVGISIIAADLSAISVMGTPAWSYGHNLELIWSTVGYVLAAPVVLLLFLPFYTRLNLYTAYEYLEKRFNIAVRLVTSALFLILRGFHVAIVIYAPSLVINMVTGLPVWQCILFIGGFTTFYTTLGGMRAVIWTDCIQFVTVVVGMVAIALTSLGKLNFDLSTAFHAAREAGRLSLFNFSTDPSELTSFWACLIGGFVLCLAPMTTDQAVLQRLFTTRSAKDARQAILIQAILTVPINLLLFLVGTCLFVFYYFNPNALSGLNVEDAILPFFAVHELPSGISGLIIAAIFAATMAVMSAGINALTTATTVDFYQRVFKPGRSAEHYAKCGRIGTACWGVLVTSVALFAKYLGALALAYNFVSSVISGPLLGIFLLGMTTRRATGPGTLTGAATGMVAVVLLSAFADLSFFWLGPIGVMTTVVVGYLASFWTRPSDAEELVGLVIGTLGPEGSRVGNQ